VVRAASIGQPELARIHPNTMPLVDHHFSSTSWRRQISPAVYVQGQYVSEWFAR
jgi:hypothetical protein